MLQEIPRENDHREDDEDTELHYTSTFAACINFVKGIIATGMWAMPIAVKDAGLVSGTIGTILVAIIVRHSFMLIVQISQDICEIYQYHSLSYSETAHFILYFGPAKTKKLQKCVCALIEYGLLLTYLGIVTVYIVFIAHSIDDLCKLRLDYYLDARFYMGMLFLPLIFVTQTTKLSHIAWISCFAIILLLVPIVIVFHDIAKGTLDTSERSLFPREMKGIPYFLGTSIFALVGCGTIMPIENEMRKPQQFAGNCGIISWTLPTISFLYWAIGFLGYMRYGDDVKSIVTLNLPQREWPSLIAKVSIIFVIYFTVAIQFHVAIEILERVTNTKSVGNSFMKVLTRIFLVFVCVVTALCVPSTEHITSLIGSLFLSITEIIYLWEHHTSKGWKYLNTTKNILLMIFSIFSCVSGTAFTMYDIISDYKAYID